jgi:hypothetical protein
VTVPQLIPCAVRVDGRPDVAPGRYLGAVFAGANPYSRLVWVLLRTRSKPAPAIADVVAAVPEVRRGFELLQASARVTLQDEETAA